MLKKSIAVLTVLCLAASLLTACRKNIDDISQGTSQHSNGTLSTVKEIRYLNFKPEVADVYKEISAAYEAETGVKLIVETAASGTYESTLTARMATDEAPTLFQINGPIGYMSWAEYCSDLKDTEIYAHLKDKSLAISSGGSVYAIPYVIEGYGIIYNNKILNNYFSLENKGTPYKSVDEIRNFAAFKALVEDMQAHKQELGIEGVFASTSLKAGEDWRWHTHLLNIPLSLEFAEKNVGLDGNGYKKIDFTHADSFKNVFDLYLNNSAGDRKSLGSVDVTASMAEFAMGKCAMVQNGNWGASQILGAAGNTVTAEDIKFMPIYTGTEGEEKQGLCIGTENYMCINAKASDEERKAAADFLYWLFSSQKGKELVSKGLGFITPFDTFSAEEVPDDPLAKEISRWMNKEGVSNIPWNFTVFPGQTFKDNLGSSLLKYAQGTMQWDEIKNRIVTDWNKEYGS